MLFQLFHLGLKCLPALWGKVISSEMTAADRPCSHLKPPPYQFLLHRRKKSKKKKKKKKKKAHTQKKQQQQTTTEVA